MNAQRARYGARLNSALGGLESARDGRDVPTEMTMKWVHDGEEGADEGEKSARARSGRIGEGEGRAREGEVDGDAIVPAQSLGKRTLGRMVSGEIGGGHAFAERATASMWLPGVAARRAAPTGERRAVAGSVLESESLDAYDEEDEELRKLRRKQSNRESARRSRLRKQMECDNLSGRVRALTRENMSLKDDYETLRGVVDSLRAQNINLREELADIRCGKIPIKN